MPKGHPIKDHLDDPDFKILFSALKYSNLKDTDFSKVAADMNCKDATFASVISFFTHCYPHSLLTHR